ncbi:inovirus Gp2 family protein [Vibrio sp. SG41-7]|uniref:inovirus Gp2 family protein n=1 Tax=Vibrio sp. SG41-7 TaxID=2760973 RepID=UPI001602B31C|nr:inovirus Gp2 family protein [Vibrio sp. SG41-7]MBB1466739.1 inovirus Gp2 family protein [Vibrio sp. SG41-7]
MNNNYFKGLPILGNLNDYNERYLDKTIDTLNHACDENKRVYAVRIDLKMPQAPQELDCLSRDEIVNHCRFRDRLISLFTESLKAKINAMDRRYEKANRRVRPSSLRFIWCRERNTSVDDHYHMVLLFNQEKFHKLGDWEGRGTLAGMIREAWASALGMDYHNTHGLVHFTKNGGFYLHQGTSKFSRQYEDLFYCLSYLAKKETKHYGEGRRNFGTSYR